MQFSRNKAKLTATIALVLLIASVTLTATVPVQAQYTNKQTGASVPLPAGVTPDETYNTLARIACRPNPIGVGQPLLVNLWTEPPVHASRLYTGLTVTITKPDGTKDVIGPMDTFYADTTAWFEYVVDQIGEYKLKFDFPGAYFPAGNYTSQASFDAGTVYSFSRSAYYKPASSPEQTVVVQQEQVLSWPVSQLPSDYWTRPISPENREWWPILGNYPATGVCGEQLSVGGLIRGVTNWPADTNKYMSNYNFIPYVQAPNTAHIVWKNQGAISGLSGGTTGAHTIDVGQGGVSSGLVGGGNPTIVYQGRAYQTYSKPGVGTSAQTYWRCYDLRTGQLYWERPLASGESAPTVISYLYTPPRVTAGGIGVPGSQARDPTQLGASLMSIGARLIKYDPWTGAVQVNGITGLALNFTGMSGTFYKDPYVLSVQTNNTAAGYRLINWTTAPVTNNFAERILSNITFPFSSLGTCDFESMIAVSTAGITPPAAGVAYGLRIMTASLTTGQLLANVTTDPTDYTQGSFSGSTQVADHGKFAVRLNDGNWHCWDLYSGKKLWVSELSSYPWGIWGIYGVSSAYGLIIYAQYDGLVAYNWTNGKVVWRYIYEAPYPYETVYDGAYPFYDSNLRIADGIIYASNTEHTPTEPLTRGWKIHAVNATTGKGIWNITGAMSPGAVADGYLTASNGYDGYMYVFGKGKSATTVSAPLTAITQGQSVVLTGTVLDQSPAQPGTPCVSKESMATYMEYLHMQKPIPSGYIVKGVPVSIDAVDPNGNYVHIADVTSDVSGTFSYMWKPEITGKYTVTATFMGDDSYGSSWAETAVGVVEAPAATPTPEPPQAAPDNTPMFAAIIAAVIVAIIIGIANLLALRKRQ